MKVKLAYTSQSELAEFISTNEPESWEDFFYILSMLYKGLDIDIVQPDLCNTSVQPVDNKCLIPSKWLEVVK